jgi:hypothetical protein
MSILLAVGRPMSFIWIVKKWMRKYKIQNQAFWQDLKAETLQENLFKLRIQWYWHVLFMGGSRVPL